MNLNEGLAKVLTEQEQLIANPLFDEIREGLKAIISSAYSKGFEDAKPVPQGLNARMDSDIKFYTNLYLTTQTSKFKHLLNSVQIALVEAKDEYELEQLNKPDSDNTDNRYHK